MSEMWKNTMLQRRRAVAESEVTDTENDRELLRELPDKTSFCSNCCSYRSAPKPQRKELRTKLKCNYVEELETRVLNEELIERELCDKQSSSKQLIDNLAEMTRTLSLYSKCLNTRHKISIRLQQLLNRIFPDRCFRPVKECTSWANVSKLLIDTLNYCEEAAIPDSYYKALCSYSDKYKDFTKASNNFCAVLQKSNGWNNVSNNDLRKLERQYESIRSEYSESKTNLNSLTDQLIAEKTSIVEKCLQNLEPAVNQIVECDKELLCLMKEIVFADLGNAAPKRINSNKSLSGLICNNNSKVYIIFFSVARRLSGENEKCTCPRGWK